MISLAAAVRVYLCTSPCDMRRGFDGLKALAEHGVGVDPLGGDLLRSVAGAVTGSRFCTGVCHECE